MFPVLFVGPMAGALSTHSAEFFDPERLARNPVRMNAIVGHGAHDVKNAFLQVANAALNE